MSGGAGSWAQETNRPAPDPLCDNGIILSFYQQAINPRSWDHLCDDIFTGHLWVRDESRCTNERSDC